MKKFLVALLMAVMLVCLTGCNEEYIITVNEEGGIEDISSVLYYTVDELNMLMSMEDDEVELTEEEWDTYIYYLTDSYVGKKYIDGAPCYGIGEDVDESTLDDMPGYEITENEFVIGADAVSTLESDEAIAEYSDADLETVEALRQMMTMDMVINMPKEIVITNGTLSNDGKTVTFDLLGGDTPNACYAYSADSDKIIEFSGLKNNYTTKSKIKVETYDKLVSVYVNGKKQKSKTIKLPEDGTYEIEVNTKYSKKAITVIKDSTKPAVTGIENGTVYTEPVKIKYKDGGAGISSAKLNGKKIKSGKTVSAAGDYTLKVTDKAGNKTTIKFSIK